MQARATVGPKLPVTFYFSARTVEPKLPDFLGLHHRATVEPILPVTYYFARSCHSWVEIVGLFMLVRTRVGPKL